MGSPPPYSSRGRPTRCRAITRRWICPVPSTMSRAFTSRKSFSTRWSPRPPTSPRISMPRLAASSATAGATALDMEAPTMLGRPWSARRAARQRGRRRGPPPRAPRREPIAHARIAEAAPLAREVERRIQRGAAHADRHGRDRGTRRVERAQRALEARAPRGASVPAEQVRRGHAAVAQRERRGLVRLEPHLALDLEVAEPRRAPLHHEGAVTIAAEARIQRREDHDPVRAARVGGEGFVAVQDPLVARLARARADARHVRARAGLRHGERSPARPIGLAEPAEEALLLVRRPPREDRRLAEARPRERRGDTAVPVRELFDHAEVPARVARSVTLALRIARPARAAQTELHQVLEEGVLRGDRAPEAIRLEAQRAHPLAAER